MIIEETPIIVRYKRTLIRLRKKMVKKGIRPITITPQKKEESPEEYERRLYRSIKWAQTSLQKA